MDSSSHSYGLLVTLCLVIGGIWAAYSIFDKVFRDARDKSGNSERDFKNKK